MRRKKKKKKREEKGRRKQEKRRPPIPSDSITQTRKCIHAATLTKIPKRVEVEVLSMFLLFFFSHEKTGRFLFKRLTFVFHFFQEKNCQNEILLLAFKTTKRRGGFLTNARHGTKPKFWDGECSLGVRLLDTAKKTGFQTTEAIQEGKFRSKTSQSKTEDEKS
jgi:hypothetical protein